MPYYQKNVEIIFLSPKLAESDRIHTEWGRDCLFVCSMIVFTLILLNQALLKGRGFPLDYFSPKKQTCHT